MCLECCLCPCLPCLWVCGCREEGVKGGSCASCIQSCVGNVEEGGVFAASQSLGASCPCCCILFVLLAWIAIGFYVIWLFEITPGDVTKFFAAAGNETTDWNSTILTSTTESALLTFNTSSTAAYLYRM